MSEYTTATNPAYTGPDRVTFITLTDPTLEEIKTIPVGSDVIVFMPDGHVTEWYWAQEVLDDVIENLEAGKNLKGHLFIYVNPAILKDPEQKEN